MTDMKIKLNAARRLLAAEAAEKDPREEALERQLDTQKEKEDPSIGDKKAILDTQEQLQRTKEQVKQRKELKKPAGERKPVGAE